MEEPLPDPLPADPLPLVDRWLAEASKVVKSATAMTLATVDADGHPTARMVICRGFDAKAGWLVFYTDRGSAKGHALAAHPRAALVFHWDVFERQIAWRASDLPRRTRSLLARAAGRAVARRRRAELAHRLARRLSCQVDEAARRQETFGRRAGRLPAWAGASRSGSAARRATIARCGCGRHAADSGLSGALDAHAPAALIGRHFQPRCEDRQPRSPCLGQRSQ
jgi:hypothetical protein